MTRKIEIFKINSEYIELIQLLKATGVAESGGQAKMIVDAQLVFRNGELETRKRAKLRAGEQIIVEGFQIDLT